VTAPFRFAANLGFLWKDRPLAERIERAAASGFDAVELHDEAQRADLGEVRAALRATGLPLLGLNARMGETMGRAALPGEEVAAREEIEEAIETARVLGAGAVHVLGGRTAPTPEAMAAYRANLAHACARAAPHGLVILIEPICEKAAPGYVLARMGQAGEIAAAVGAPNLRVLFDVYHVAQAGDPLAETFAAHAALVGHVQLADPVSRAEPRLDGPPERAAPPLLRAFARAGYRGVIGCEYRPAASEEEGLGWLAALRNRLGEPSA
jgi:hydroxypyruvate isomerase